METSTPITSWNVQIPSITAAFVVDFSAFSASLAIQNV